MKTNVPRFAPYMSTPEIVWHYVLRSANVMVLLFLILPILAIMPLSFNENSFLVYPIHQFSLRWYHNLFTAVEWTRAGANSLIVTPIATVLATVLGTLAALGLNKASFKGKGVLVAVLISPMIVPVIVTGVGMYLQFARWGLSGTYAGLIFGHTVIAAPFVVVTVNATLAGFNHNYVRASLSLGASPVRTFFSVTLPIIAPGVISGALFAFATSLDDVVITMFIAGPTQGTLPLQMFIGIRESITPTIAALASILIVFSSLLLITMEWLRSRSVARQTAS
ncbi:ABC transporter permease [Paraburkholderia caribensis]|jgi:putative spermidine/putrescine transport system permease protein|uniref:ABC transporter permease n=1 Tax=Paraburkholderia caribensis TaxID=75105 RepID=UPI00072248BC|nr:ABC transporter permease [Paraburkholderia caribensis]ALP68679.1 polyamine ABC transporter permease [Paraburkholderia caribensis]AUT58042.1 ABC transporter permease [Paraburkholderia caribensis]